MSPSRCELSVGSERVHTGHLQVYAQIDTKFRSPLKHVAEFMLHLIHHGKARSFWFSSLPVREGGMRKEVKLCNIRLLLHEPTQERYEFVLQVVIKKERININGTQQSTLLEFKATLPSWSASVLELTEKIKPS